MSALDFKLGLRMLRRYPGITVIGTVAMAVAISLGTLYFEGLHKGLYPTLPAPAADRIVAVRYWDLGKRAVEDRSLHDFAIARANVKTIEPLGAAVAFSRNLVTADHRVEAVRGAEITANAFTVMGTTPLLGRTLTARDEQPAEPLVVVIGEQLWRDTVRARSLGGWSIRDGGHRRRDHRRRHAGTLRLSGEPAPLAAAAHRRIPARAAHRTARVDLRSPRARRLDATGAGRTPVISAGQAASRSPTPTRTCSRGSSATARRRSKATRPDRKNVLYAANAFFLLLLAVICTNVATLVFARTATRGWEIAVRNALGASRRRIIAQLFTEALVLAAVAAVLGIASAKLALRWGLDRHRRRRAAVLDQRQSVVDHRALRGAAHAVGRGDRRRAAGAARATRQRPGCAAARAGGERTASASAVSGRP